MMGPMRASVTGLLTAVATVAAGAGCGGASDPRAPATTHAAYVRTADGVCQAHNAKLAEISGQAFPDSMPTTPELRMYVRETFLPFVTGELERLRALDRPAADEARLDRIYAMAERDLQRIERDPTLLAAEAATSPFADVNAEFAAFGLKVCGSG